MDANELKILTDAFTASRQEDMDRVLRTLNRELDQRFDGVARIVDDLCPRVDKLEEGFSKVRGVIMAFTGLAGIAAVIQALKLLHVL